MGLHKRGFVKKMKIYNLYLCTYENALLAFMYIGVITLTYALTTTFMYADVTTFMNIY